MFRPPSIIASEENQFRSIVSLIRAKYNSAVSIYSSKLNTFFTISQTAPVFVIKNKAMELYMSEQMMVIFDEARSLSETVLDAYRCIFTNNPVPSFNDKWLRLCSLRSILEIPQLTCFCYEHKGDRVPQRSLLTLYDVGGYLRNVVSTRTNNQSIKQRIFELFPEQSPQQIQNNKPVMSNPY